MINSSPALIQFKDGTEKPGTVSMSRDGEVPEVVSFDAKVFALSGYSYDARGQGTPIYSESQWGMILTLDGKEPVAA